MKKLIALFVVMVLAFAAIGLVACDTGKEETTTGSVSYTSWGHTYGAKVDVTVKGDKITNVKLYTDAETGWVGLSAAMGDKWTDANRKVWTDGAEAYVKSFVGMTKEEVLELKATIKGVNGATADKVEGITYVTGATQSSARVVLAIQNALGAKAPATYTGEYKYENYGHTYGAKVDVTVFDGEIIAINLYTDEASGYVNLSDANDAIGWTDENRKVWTDGSAAFVNSFVGKTVTEINALTATIKDVADAEANKVEGMTYVTGATQSSARVILAVQNALSKIAA